nr:Methionyl-tRNA formyltransferase [Penicillium fuscum]
MASKLLSSASYQCPILNALQPPKSQGSAINLVVAVSFGLFVPRRILEEAKYGGLNVHPSILPDFHGPAPLQHTLLTGCKFAGVTVQTLHPKHFDRGRILAQTPPPGWEHRCRTVPELLEQVAPVGADMLLTCIKSRLYLASNDITEEVRDVKEAAAARAAPKITPNDRFIDWETWTAEEIMRRHRVIGPLWSFARFNDEGNSQRRIIWSTGFDQTSNTPVVDVPVGQPVVIGTESSAQNVYVRTCDNRMLAIGEIKIEGGEQAKPIQAAKKAGMADGSTLRNHGHLFTAQISMALSNPTC